MLSQGGVTFADLADGAFDRARHVDSGAFGKRGRLTRPATKPHRTGQLLREEVNFFSDAGGTPEIVEGLRFLKFGLEFLQPSFVGCFRLGVEQIPGVCEPTPRGSP